MILGLLILKIAFKELFCDIKKTPQIIDEILQNIFNEYSQEILFKCA